MRWLKHAFAVDPPGPARPSEAQRLVIDRICREVVRRRMVAPATLVLEMSRPLNYVSAQFLRFLEPIVTAVTDADQYAELAAFLEQRGSIEYISQRLEVLEAQKSGDARRTGSGSAPRTTK